VLDTARTIPDESVLTLFSQVRERVWQATGGRQVPWESSTLVRPFRLAPAQAPAATGDDAAPEAASPARSPAPPPPAALSLTLPLDRAVPLGPALAQALDTPLGAVSVTAMPENGRIAFDTDGAPVFHPTLEERRAAGLESFTLSDRFTLETGPAEARRPVSVTLTLEAGECDLAAGDALDLQGVGLYRLPNEIPVARALSACAEAVAAAPGSGRLRYQLGRAQQASGRLAEAFESFRIAAEAGHVRALNAQAYLLFTTRIDRAAVGIPLDEARAAGLLERGIAAGDPFAIHSRGLRLLRHGATPAERERGFDLLNRAAELGHTYSMNELGVYFLTRDGAHYQPERGMRYLAASSARDDIYGHHNLGFVALFGLDGKPPDHARARAWFERAAAGGHPFSPAALGRMIIRGQGGPVDRPAAVAWYDMGLARGDGWGGTNAAEIILGGGVSGLGPADAAVRAAKAAHLPAEDAAAAALALLDAMPAAALDRATQMILADIGEAVTVDGRVGPATRAALDRVRARTGLPRAADTPRERLLLAARAYWAERPSRPDLF
jgi:TPR repeat protein